MNKIVLLMLATVSLSACQTAQEQCVEAKNFDECVAVAEAGGDVNDYLLYGMIGYMIGSQNGKTVIMRDPHYTGKFREIPSYRKAYERRTAPPKTTSTSKPGFSKTTTRTTYGSSFRSSSFRSSSFRVR